MNQRQVCIGIMAALCLLVGNALAAQSASRNDILLSAASPFEDLTEYALAANKKGMKLALKAYADQAVGVNEVVSEKTRNNIDGLIATIKKSERRGDNETIALKSVEVYRILIESLDVDSLVVPIQISLLDYAGFKFETLLHARSTNWPELKKVAEEAHRNWVAVQPRVADKALRDTVEAAVAGMYKACIEKNAEMAVFAGQIDLALVDILEGYFERASQ
ncbi:MAG: hypothetical protein P8012_05575 [Desulfobacterales bacterium]